MPDPLLTRELYTAFINTTLLELDEQQSVTQLLIYLLPACNSDTLHRLLEFLSTVADHANDQHTKDGQEIPGNKMTYSNLATIFGPNLLHKQKSSDKEFSVQSSARAEESTAVIAVLQRMIAGCHTLFMVPPDLQNEVLMSLLETDPDVVDYLLRRKASQSPDLLQPEEPFSLSERRSSSDSNKVSSGEVSPYDNNSPVLSERRGEPGSPASEQQFPVVEQVPDWSREPSKEEHANIWGTWHSTLKPVLKNQSYTGSHGNMSEDNSHSSQEGLDGPHGDVKLQTDAKRTHTALECRTHPPITRLYAAPHSQTGRPRLQLNINPAVTSHLNSMQGSLRSPSDGRFPPPYNAHRRVTGSQSSPQLATPPRHQLQPGRQITPQTNSGQMVPQSAEWQDWQRERWQIWQLLSSDNADTLPETLV
ncbi:hypothetical protein CHARACLAT_007934 [Characodon lateralis]|uniref:Rho-GAP domain-containing protein n=1 Tax=Characodon lateralis TaxID=208331 RepID=A0ABU7CNI7_9TELE|nr:hypothetical protein [Characodon lateralis]